MSKILLITYSLCGGGAERVVSVLSNAWVKGGHEVGLFVYRPTNNDYKVDDSVIRFTLPPCYDEKSGSSLNRAFTRVKSIRDAMRLFKPNYCIPFLDSMVQESWMASVRIHVPIIATCRNKPDENAKLKNLIRNFVFTHCSSLYLQTESQRAFFPKNLQKKAFAVNNAVDQMYIDAAQKRIYSGKITKLVSCGRLHPQKNQVLLIRAIAAVHVNHPNITLNIFGHGELKDELQQLINTLNAQDYIFLKGYVDNTLNVLMDAHLFVFTSNFEGSPNALIEAMATGLPVCSTDCPTGPAELIGNNERGVLVPLNDLNSFVSAINNIISNPKEAEKRGIIASQYIAKYYSPLIISQSLVNEIEKRL